MGKRMLGTVLMTAACWGRVPATRSMDVVAHISHLDPADFEIAARAKELASGLMERAGVQLRWSQPQPGCENIEIQMDPDAPSGFQRESLAYALPFAKGPGPRIHIFRDRLPDGRGIQPHVLLAYVIVHEIVHVLDGMNRHSEGGVMKARWDYADYLAMGHRTLTFSAEDLYWIREHFHSTQLNSARGATAPHH